jgi:F-type H+-transporting ATPase subunit b
MMRIDWWTLGLQTINLLVLVWILSRFLFRPIAKIIAKRQSDAAKLLDDANAARARAEEEEKQAAKDEAEAAAARSGVLKSAAKEAEGEKAALVAAAREEADRLRAEAKAEIARMHKTEEASNNDRASRLAVDIAERLFDRLPDAARIDGFVDGLASGLTKLPDAARTEIGASGAPVKLKAARALTTAETARCQSVISKALGRTLDLEIVIDPALIAGLEIETPHAVVRNNFRADLDRIAAELTRDDREES